MLWGIEMCELIDNPVSIREKKTKLLQAIFNEMQSSNITAIPTHLDQTYLTVQDSQYKDRPIQISMDNLNLVKVVIIYHQYQYDNTLDDRRNAIKTARDIFDFYHDMQTGSYDKVSESLHGKVLPKLSLYYQNSPSINSVIVTATMRSSSASMTKPLHQVRCSDPSCLKLCIYTDDPFSGSIPFSFCIYPVSLSFSRGNATKDEKNRLPGFIELL